MPRGNQKRKTLGPLLVRDVILPKREQPDTNKITEKPVNVLIENPTGTCTKIGDHEVKPIFGLKSLEKKIQENYFAGTTQQKRSRRVKQQKSTHSFKEILNMPKNNSEGIVDCIESEIQPPKETVFDIIKKKNIQRELQLYEKMKQDSDKNLQMRQRLVEEKLMKEQENLAETFLTMIRQRSKPKPHRSTYNNRLRRSVTSQKGCNHEPGLEKERKSETKREKQCVDNLGKTLLHELVLKDGPHLRYL